jgi:hypothetical protein
MQSRGLWYNLSQLRFIVLISSCGICFNYMFKSQSEGEVSRSR